MDLLIVIEKIKAGQLTLQDPVPVSAKSAKTGGSQVYLAEKEVFTLDEMLYALMVQSANDAAVAIAEKVAGSTEAFVALMNQRAKQLGMNNTVLKHPEVLRYTSTRERPFRPGVAGKTVVMRTHNHLLASLDGCDGLKTGYITVAGFSIAVTASRNGQRVVAMVLGSSDRKVRDAKASELVAKGFAALTLAPAQPAAAPVPAPAKSAKK
jgi:D-alanyl-D-alanine carboxypeptidase (penicillin-binding protein 5/6)